MISGVAYLVSALTVYILTSAIKPYLEAWLVPVQNKDGKPNTLHDPTIRLFAFVLGAAANLTIYFVYTGHHDGPGVFTALMVGLGAALTAIGTYHLETTSYFDIGKASQQNQASNGTVASLTPVTLTKAEVVTPVQQPVAQPSLPAASSQ